MVSPFRGEGGWRRKGGGKTIKLNEIASALNEIKIYQKRVIVGLNGVKFAKEDTGVLELKNKAEKSHNNFIVINNRKGRHR